MFSTTAIGGLAGLQAGGQARQNWETEQSEQSLQEQFELGTQDLEAGRYEIARQRFEYILSQDPNFPGATEKLAQAMQVLYDTATPTPLPPTTTPTPTRDLRPVEDLFSQAQSLMASEDWSGAIDTFASLRKEDRAYRSAEVDGMLYLALRNRGVNKILKDNNLEGGIYDLALAERFGPLDVDAETARGWARLYMIGNSFWEAYPDQAVHYFSQVAAAAPYLRDASGWTARSRYRAALVQYGDQLARNGDWCEAQTQYELAQSIEADGIVEATAVYAAEQCSPPTPTPLPITDTPTPTETQVLTETPWVELTPTPTLEVTPTLEPTPIPSETPAPQPSETPTPQPPEEPTATIPAEPATQAPDFSTPTLDQIVPEQTTPPA